MGNIFTKPLFGTKPREPLTDPVEITRARLINQARAGMYMTMPAGMQLGLLVFFLSGLAFDGMSSATGLLPALDFLNDAATFVPTMAFFVLMFAISWWFVPVADIVIQRVRRGPQKFYPQQLKHSPRSMAWFALGTV